MITYLIMLESHPAEQVLGYRENVPQHIDLKLIKGLIDIGLEQSL